MVIPLLSIFRSQGRPALSLMLFTIPFLGAFFPLASLTKGSSVDFNVYCSLAMWGSFVLSTQGFQSDPMDCIEWSKRSRFHSHEFDEDVECQAEGVIKSSWWCHWWTQPCLRKDSEMLRSTNQDRVVCQMIIQTPKFWSSIYQPLSLQTPQFFTMLFSSLKRLAMQTAQKKMGHFGYWLLQ